jgi:hypothetical protein
MGETRFRPGVPGEMFVGQKGGHGERCCAMGRIAASRSTCHVSVNFTDGLPKRDSLADPLEHFRRDGTRVEATVPPPPQVSAAKIFRSEALLRRKAGREAERHPNWPSVSISSRKTKQYSSNSV